MAKTKTFRLRKKPVAPERKEGIREEYSLNEGDSLAPVVEWAQRCGVPFESICAQHEYGYYDNPDTIMFVLKRPQTDKEFAPRQKQYEKQLAAYEAWEAENKEAIEAELARRAAAEEKRKIKERKRLEREIAAHEKKAAKLRKRL